MSGATVGNGESTAIQDMVVVGDKRKGAAAESSQVMNHHHCLT